MEDWWYDHMFVWLQKRIIFNEKGDLNFYNNIVLLITHLKDKEEWIVIEEHIARGKTFYPFVAFSNPTPSANEDQIKVIETWFR